MSASLAFAWGLLLGAVVGMVYAAWVARRRRKRNGGGWTYQCDCGLCITGLSSAEAVEDVYRWHKGLSSALGAATDAQEGGTLRDRHGRTPDQCWVAGDVFLFGGGTLDGEPLP